MTIVVEFLPMYTAGNPVRIYTDVANWRCSMGGIVITFEDKKKEIIASNHWLRVTEKI